MRLHWALAPVLFCQLLSAQGVIAIYPAPTSVDKGTTRQFTSYVTVSPSTLAWSVNGIAGGNATYGTITANGLYSAPAVIPPDNVVKVRATSTAKPAIYGESSVTISQPTPWVWSTYPNALTTGTSRSIKLNGSNFIPQAVVNVGGVPWTTTYINATTLTAVGDLPAAGTFAVTVTHPNPGGVTSQGYNIKATTAPPAEISVTVSPTSASLALAASTQFTASVAVTWSATAGTISSTGLYTAPATMPASPAVTVRATSTANPAKYAQATVTLQSGNPGGGGGTPGNNGSNLSAGRFLEQAAFGPTNPAIADVQAKGNVQWLDDQISLAETQIAIPPQGSSVQSQTLNRLAMAPDQLRQRVAWALGQIIVISMNKNIYADEYVPYQQILSRNAFGNYRTLLYDIAVSPQMGKYLDLANSNKPGVGSGANENFPRELMQLFSIGLYQLNPDGSQVLVNGQPVATYSQNDVRQVALALTGWTYPTATGAQPSANNWENFSVPVMETRPANHDTSQKTFLNGCVLPAGQTVQQDMDGVLDCVFNHPNTPPFVATRLIRALVASNPSAAYIQRISGVFANNGSGVRGDLKAVVKAILLDTEARNDTATPNSGRLKDPVYLIVSFVRALNGKHRASDADPVELCRAGRTSGESALGLQLLLADVPAPVQTLSSSDRSSRSIRRLNR